MANDPYMVKGTDDIERQSLSQALLLLLLVILGGPLWFAFVLWLIKYRFPDQPERLDEWVCTVLSMAWWIAIASTFFWLYV